MSARAAIGGRIARALGKRTQMWLAKELGASQPSVSEWVRGDSQPDADHLVRLPAILGVSGHWLLTGIPPMERTASEVSLEETYRMAFAEVLHLVTGRVLDTLEALTPAEGDDVLGVVNQLPNQKAPAKRRSGAGPPK